ncbi:MAG TPA: PAS domain S-box protein, partial [Tepidiformaceae bacterium]|nr:PAS domain S-box protein [Tepidiformaceae bacterium]
TMTAGPAHVTLRPLAGTAAAIATITPGLLAAPAELLDLIVESSTAGIALTNSRGEIVRVNSAWAEFAGVSPADIIGRTLWAGIPRSQREEARRSTEAVIAGDPNARLALETEIVRPDGGRRTLIATCQPVGPAHARFLVVTALDVTAERRAEAALEASERELRAMFDHTGAALALLDEAGHYVRVNRAWCDVLGWTAEEVVGRHFRDIAVTAPGEQAMRLFHEKVAEPRRRALAMRHRDGSTRWVLNETSEIEVRGERRILSTSQDITDLRLAEAALRADEALLDSIFETTAGGVALVDEDQRIIRVNRAGMEMVGWDESLIGKPLWELVPADVREEGRENLRRLLTEGTPLPAEYLLERRDGTPLRVLGSATRLELDGRHRLLLTVLDVTAQRTAEAALRESEARYRLLVETVHEGIWMTNADGVTTYANEQAAAIMGVTPEAMIGKPFKAVISEEDMRAGAAIGRRRREGVSEQYDFRVHRLDGEVRWVMVSASALKNARGEFSGTIVSMVDITTRKQQEEELGRLATIVDSATDIIIDRDPEGRITAWNQGAQRSLGYTAEEVLGTAGEALGVSPEDATPGVVRLVLTGKTFDVVEAPRRHKDGRTIWVSGTMFPRRDSDGRIAGVSSITRDVTHEREAREALARMAAIVDASTDVIISFGPDGRITSWNRSAERVFGYSAAEAIGQDMGLIQIPGEPTRWPENFERALQGESVGATGPRLESRRRRRDGTEVIFEVSIFPVRDAAGEVAGVVVSGSDIGERKRHEREVERLAAIVDSSLDAILLVNRDGRIESWNRAAEENMGWTAAEVIGQPLALLDPPGSTNLRTTRVLAHAFADALTPEESRLETRRRAKDGTIHPFLVTLFPIKENGEVVSVGIIAREISDLRSQQEAMARLAAIVESSNDAICGLDLDANVVSWNRHAEELFGHTAAEVLGQNRLPVTPREYFRREAALIERLRQGEPFNGDETVRLHKDGTAIDLNLSGFPVRNERDEIVGYALVARDVREQKQQRDAIQRLASIVESSSDLIFTLSTEGRITSWNRAAAELSGVGEADMIGRPLEVFDREDSGDDGLRPLFERALRGELMAGVTARRWRLDGRAIDLQLHVFPLRSKEGAISGVAVTARDITRQKAEERARLDLEERLRLVLQSTPLVLFACDTNGLLLVVEGRGLDTLGVVPSRILGRSFVDLCTAAGMTTEVDAFRLALQGEIVTTNSQVRDVTIEVRYSPVRGSDGAITGVAAVGIDVTQRRKAEQARREAEARAHTIAESTPVILWSCDADGVLTYIEGMGLELIGPPRPRPGMNILQGGDGEAELADGVRRALAGEHVSNLITVRGRQLEGTISPTRDERGRIVGAVGVANDVTERRKADQALIQAQKMESLGVLAGGIAHDFNNLLVAVMGNADLALLRMEGDDETRQLLGDIKAASRRAADLARQMLAYSGKGTFILGRFEVEGLVREISDLLRVSLGHGVKLEYDFAAGGAFVEGDATQIRQVVMNLVINASEAMDDGGGVVSVKTGIVQATRRTFAGMYLSPDLPEGEYVEVRVSDTGHGMDAATASRIFDPFFTTKFTGRGLGLAAVLGIVRGHRGAISVSSAEGHGTTFTLLLPRA